MEQQEGGGVQSITGHTLTMGSLYLEVASDITTCLRAWSAGDHTSTHTQPGMGFEPTTLEE